MKNSAILTFCLSLLLLPATLPANNPGKATVRVVEKQLLTYAYSDPREEPDFGRIYPYCRYDGFSAQGQMQTWEMVELENDYLKLWVMPGVGGKVWGAVDKATGREFLYFNHVVKFRDVAMRGPWTSGGVEFNFGVVGHSPWCSDSVDFATHTYPDGSVSCTVGSRDLALETDWRVEVVLSPERACFETRVLWFNGSGSDRPSYQWMNSGVKTAGNLEYVFSGSYYLEHDGLTRPWPTDAQGHALNWYEKNDFGGYKSYHVAGRYSDFWGAWWHDDAFGMGHSADYGEKPGKKVWIWGLSDQGMIWEELLTDTDGQYTELQAGRHLNQTTALCYRTPYKHAKLSPYSTASWTEYWYPVTGLDGMIYGSEELAFNIVERSGKTFLKIYAVSPLHDMLRVTDGERELASRRLDMTATRVDSIELPGRPLQLKLSLGGRTIYDAAPETQTIARPRELPADFDHNSLQGLYLQGREYERQFFLTEAAAKYREALEKDPNYLPALTALSGIAYERGEHASADSLLLRALAIDTYDGAANYLFGLNRAAQGDVTNALEALSIACQSTEYGPAAYTEQGRLLLRDRNFSKACRMLDKALESNPLNLRALEMKAVAARLAGDETGAKAALEALENVDRINHLVVAERFLAGEADDFREKLRGSYWFESYISLADFYQGLGCYEDALSILDAAPAHTKIAYWQAALRGPGSDFDPQTLERAYGGDQSGVYSFRKSEAGLFNWMNTSHPAWQSAYQAALRECRADRGAQALKLLSRYEDAPFYPYYLLRASLQTAPELQKADLQKARELAPRHPRTALRLARFYEGQGQWGEAVRVLDGQYRLDPADYSIGMALAGALSGQGDYAGSLALMKKIKVLPYEGAQDGRILWRESNLRFAAGQLAAGRYKAASGAIAAARTWPRNLGVGKPYDAMIDERVEDLFEAYLLQKTKASEGDLMKRIARYADSTGYKPYRAADLLTALALRAQGRGTEADAFLKGWLDKDSKSQAARWCAALWQGDTAGARAVAAEAPQALEAMPYVTVFEDRDFQLLKNNVSIIQAVFKN